MPRIRTVKPEFCTSEQVATCSHSARLLFILMWLHCDDAGRHPESVKRLKMECFPGDDLSVEDVEKLVAELINADLMVRYEWEGRGYWQVSGWQRHQKIDKPNCRYPPLDSVGNPIPVVDMSGNIRRQVFDLSPPDGSLQGVYRESTSAAALAVVDEWSLTDFEEVVRQANKLRKACRSLDREFVWQVCVIGETVAPGMIGEIAGKATTGEIRKPKSYIEKALREECSRKGFDWIELVPHVPAPPPPQNGKAIQEVAS